VVAWYVPGAVAPLLRLPLVQTGLGSS